MNLDLWQAVGYAGQALFTGRFLVQWLASEKRKESVVPVAFWWLSLGGSILLAVYAAYLRDPVFLLGPLINGFLYLRNLLLIYLSRARQAKKRVLVPTSIAILTFIAWSFITKRDTSIPLPWLVVGFLGTALWSGRWVIQWFVSERQGKSVMPRAFWYVGLAGSVILLAYSVYRKEPVFILGYLFPPIPYIRNLVLIYRKEGAPILVRKAQDIWAEPRRRAVAIAIFGVLLAAFLTVRVLRATHPARDFLRYHAAASRLQEGQADGLDVLLAPIGLIPANVAEVLWACWNAAAVFLLLAVCRRLCRAYGVRAAWMWIPFLFIIRFAWDSMNGGEIHPTTALLATAGLLFAEIGRPARAGLLLGMAGAIRPVMLLLLPYLLLRRKWRAVGSGVAAFLLLGVAIPAAVLGPDLFLAKAREVLAEQFGTGEVDGESLRAMAHLVLSGPAAEVLYRVSAAAALLALAVFALRGGSGLRTPLVSGAALATVLLVVPETEKSMLVLLALPATVAVHAIARCGAKTARGRTAAVLFGLAFLLASLPSRAIVGEEAATMLSRFSAGGIGALLLLVTMWILPGLVGSEEQGDEA